MPNGIDFVQLQEVIETAVTDYIRQARESSDCGLPPECVPVMFCGTIEGALWPFDKPEKPVGFRLTIASGFPLKPDNTPRPGANDSGGAPCEGSVI